MYAEGAAIYIVLSNFFCFFWLFAVIFYCADGSMTSGLWKKNLWFAFLVFLAVTIPYNCLFVEMPYSFSSGNVGRLIGYWIAGFLLSGAVLLLVIVVCVIGVIRASLKTTKEQKAMRHLADDESKIFALQELDSGNIDKLTWAKALIAADGDEIKARAEYLKIRKKPAE